MSILNPLFIAFSMYSKVPVPQTEWNEKNMRYALCFFPAVGALEGLLFYWLWKLLVLFSMPVLIRGAVLCVFPILYTGGIHMDGFLDTADALASHAEQKRKLEILKDSHIGSFAVIAAAAWFVLYFSCCAELQNEKQILILAGSFVMSRSYSGLSLVYFRNARGSGLAFAFSDAAQKKITRTVLILYVIADCIYMYGITPMIGLAAMASAFLLLLYYRIFSYDEFGGITGDTSGFFLEITELVMMIVIVLAGQPSVLNG